MGNSFVLFDVSIVISHGQFHCGNRGHTQNTDFPWVKSHFPVGKRSSGTTAILSVAGMFSRQTTQDATKSPKQCETSCTEHFTVYPRV